MFSAFAQQMYTDAVRHALTALGTYLIAKGIMQSSQINDLLGSGFFIANLAWQWFENSRQDQAKKVAATTIAAEAASNG